MKMNVRSEITGLRAAGKHTPSTNSLKFPWQHNTVYRTHQYSCSLILPKYAKKNPQMLAAMPDSSMLQQRMSLIPRTFVLAE